jgi:hypothetical protein
LLPAAVRGAGGAGNPVTLNFVTGLSGCDITKENIVTMYRKVIASAGGETEPEMQFAGLRWEPW